MKQFTPQELRDVLNYDTNQEKSFGLVERHQIHRAISKRMDGRDQDLPVALFYKVREVQDKIKLTGYQAKEVAYYLDQETMHIKSKISII